MDVIELDEKTTQMLRDGQMVLNQIQTRMEALVQGFLNGRGLDGEYRLNEDATKLIPIVKADGEIK